jgi:hypothetical protein
LLKCEKRNERIKITENFKRRLEKRSGKGLKGEENDLNQLSEKRGKKQNITK